MLQTMLQVINPINTNDSQVMLTQDSGYNGPLLVWNLQPKIIRESRINGIQPDSTILSQAQFVWITDIGLVDTEVITERIINDAGTLFYRRDIHITIVAIRGIG